MAVRLGVPREKRPIRRGPLSVSFHVLGHNAKVAAMPSAVARAAVATSAPSRQRLAATRKPAFTKAGSWQAVGGLSAAYDWVPRLAWCYRGLALPYVWVQGSSYLAWCIAHLVRPL